MKIALDVMGGDRAPGEIVAGAVEGAREHKLEIVLVGRRSVVEVELARHDTNGLALSIVDAPEVVSMNESPAASFRAKRNSSIAVGLGLLRDREVAGFVSAGNSGAVMAAALFLLGRIKGIERPALATVFPTLPGKCLLIDVGANADCKPPYLAQFGLMGSVYMEKVFGCHHPKVGLLSNGEEDSKGNLLVQEARPFFQSVPVNFVGNVEGKDIPYGLADVVVTDGFTGNVALKLSEGIGEVLFQLLREELTKGLLSQAAAAALRPAFRRVRQRLDYQEYGGAPLLGVEGACSIAHGRSSAKAIKNAIRVTRQAAEGGVVAAIAERAGRLVGATRGT